MKSDLLFLLCPELFRQNNFPSKSDYLTKIGRFPTDRHGILTILERNITQ